MQRSILREGGCTETLAPDKSEEVVFHQSDVFKCSSCGFLSLRFLGIQVMGPEVEVWYPPEMARRRLAWWSEIPDGSIRELLAEIYSLVVHDNTRLAAMGIRTLIEQLAIEKAAAAPNSTFLEKLRMLAAKGLIASNSQRALEQVLELGHAAVHRNHRPHMTPLVQCLDVVENMLHAIYILPGAAREIGLGTPRRQK
jgi:hypothetical protein